MGIIRKQNFSSGNKMQICDQNLLDTPERLINFARQKNIAVVPLDIEKLANELGVLVCKKPLMADLSGILMKNIETDKWIIEVNSRHHPNRQRYTIAHELGHYCLHRYFSNIFEDEIYFRSTESSKTEGQANNFAGEILIPEKIFKQKIREGIRDVEELARVFQVSSLAIRIRAKNLGMTGHGL